MSAEKTSASAAFAGVDRNLEAAARTPGVATDPAPYVVQTALSDFYVEYRLCCQGNHSAPHRRADAMSQLQREARMRRSGAPVFEQSNIVIRALKTELREHIRPFPALAATLLQAIVEAPPVVLRPNSVPCGPLSTWMFSRS